METSFHRNPMNTREISFTAFQQMRSSAVCCASLYANATTCLLLSPKLLVYGPDNNGVVSRDLDKLLTTHW